MTDAQKLIILLVVYAVAFIVQWILSSRKGAWFGILLPCLSLAAVAIYTAFVHGGEDFTQWLTVVRVVLLFLVYNIGTTLLIVIYALVRKGMKRRRHKREQEQAAEDELIRQAQEIEQAKLQRKQEKIEAREARRAKRKG